MSWHINVKDAYGINIKMSPFEWISGKPDNTIFKREIYKLTNYSNIHVDKVETKPSKIYIETYPGESMETLWDIIKMFMHMYIVSQGAK